jgi:MerR family regulatory protein
MEASRNYRIGEVAERTGVSVETLRYYEKRRLLRAAAAHPGRLPVVLGRGRAPGEVHQAGGCALKESRDDGESESAAARDADVANG